MAKRKLVLDNGPHLVKIVNTRIDLSEVKKTQYLECSFKNDYGFHKQRFYIKESLLGDIRELFYICDLPTDWSSMDEKQLIGKEVILRIKDDEEYCNKQTGELIQRKKAYDFQKTITLTDKKE